VESIIGRTILGYKIIEIIGTGGFGNVYRVEKNNIVGNANRALKVVTLPKENQYTEVLNSMGGDYEKADRYFKLELDRVVDEIRVFSMLSEKDNHNIVSYYENDVEEIGKHKYNIYILMEYLTPLDKWLQSNNMTVANAVDIGISIAKALKICHENKIMHRDVKLNNVFVSKDGKFKLGDFGVSKRLDTMTRANTIKGTPHYIAPEVYSGKEKYNYTVDIYSLGILLYYLFNKSRFPFYPDYPNEYNNNDEDRAFYQRMKYEELKAPLCAPDNVAKIILKAVSEPQNRYKTVTEFLEDFENAKSELEETELQEYIGFEPVVKMEDTVSAKEDGLVDNLEDNMKVSISFGEHSIETISKKINNGLKKWAYTGVIAVAIILGIVFLAFAKKKSDMENVFESQAISETGDNDISESQGIKEATEITSFFVSDEQNTVAESIVEVAEYKNKKYSEVYEQLSSAGFQVEKVSKYSSSVKKGRIVEQSISAGTKVVTGAKIVLTVSKGAKKESATTSAREEITTKVKTSSQNNNNNKLDSSNDNGNSNKDSGKTFNFGEIVE